MKIKALSLKEESFNNNKLNQSISQLQELIRLLNQREIPTEVVTKINAEIDEINVSNGDEGSLLKLIKQKQSNIIKILEKDLKIVPLHYYRNFWMLIGMSAFGLPLGLTFSLILDNIGLLAIGLPIGLAIGIAYGSQLDKTAKEEGRQLDIELK